MRTSKQIAASRANGARSKGPVTAQGKQNSSRNSIRHGLLAETVVLQDEHTGRFFELLNELVDEHQPSTPTEMMLVEGIAVASWRRSRIWGMQKENFDHDVAISEVDTDSPALRAVLTLRGSAECIRSHEVLIRYEVAFDRQISRSLVRLQQLQEKRASRTGQPLPVQEKTTTARRTQQPAENITPPPLARPANPPSPAPSPAPPPANQKMETEKLDSLTLVDFQPVRAETSPTQRSRPGAQNRS